ncbi:MAG: FtsW/RodA/SpoVE family cell cycle protein [Armatimonadetes bacterium]|nr:FtsW/RodA/SpoVE family cell cycle protein [Armatimonadota bacterium]MDW8122667.1 FtsW/RodA/SpoVE family cell cycle protein [Armatimonadota bacterium]
MSGGWRAFISQGVWLRAPLWVIGLTAVGVCVGLVLLFSASHPYSAVRFGDDPVAVTRKQVLAAVVGAVLFVVAWGTPLSLLKRWGWLLHLLSLALLVLALVSPPMGGTSVHRWVRIGPFILQPSELAKVTLPLLVACLVDFLRRLSAPLPRLLLWLIIAGNILGTFLLIALEPHLSGAVIVSSIGLFAVFFSGLPLFRTFLIAAVAGLLLWGARGHLLKPYQLRRLEAVLNQREMTTQERYQQEQAKVALGVSGLFGQGLFKGRQKQLILPTPHNDFIFAAIGEEIGWVSVCLLLLFYWLIAFVGLGIGSYQPDAFGAALAGALTMAIWLQAVLHILVNTGLFAVTGVPLPFVSAGGSSLCSTLAAMGLLCNLARRVPKIIRERDQQISSVTAPTGGRQFEVGSGRGRDRRASVPRPSHSRSR